MSVAILNKGKSEPWQKTSRRRLSVRTPAGKRSTQTITVKHEVDPKQALLERIGEVPDGLVQFSRILVAVYQPPMIVKTDSGLFLPDALKQEDVDEFLWQGKVGLIVAMGPQAYVDDETTKFHGTKNKIGDWVWFSPSNGIQCDVNEVFCRLLREGDIFGTLPHPDYVW